MAFEFGKRKEVYYEEKKKKNDFTGMTSLPGQPSDRSWIPGQLLDRSWAPGPGFLNSYCRGLAGTKFGLFVKFSMFRRDGNGAGC